MAYRGQKQTGVKTGTGMQPRSNEDAALSDKVRREAQRTVRTLGKAEAMATLCETEAPNVQLQSNVPYPTANATLMARSDEQVSCRKEQK